MDDGLGDDQRSSCDLDAESTCGQSETSAVLV